MAANTQSYPAFTPASTLTRAPRPTFRVAASTSLCRNCGTEYYPQDIPAILADVGQYGTCVDCREEFAAEMADWTGAEVWA